MIINDLIIWQEVSRTGMKLTHPNGKYPSTLEINLEDDFGEATIYLTKKEVLELKGFLDNIDISTMAGGC